MQTVIIYRDGNNVLCTDCKDADYNSLVVCKKLFEEIEKEKQWVTNKEGQKDEKIYIQSITFKI